MGAAAIPLATAFIGAGASIYGANKAGKIKPPAPEKPPQLPKAPKVEAFKRDNIAAARAGQSSTLLTGAGGLASSNATGNSLLGL